VGKQGSCEWSRGTVTYYGFEEGWLAVSHPKGKGRGGGNGVSKKNSSAYRLRHENRGKTNRDGIHNRKRA